MKRMLNFGLTMVAALFFIGTAWTVNAQQPIGNHVSKFYGMFRGDSCAIDSLMFDFHGNSFSGAVDELKRLLQRFDSVAMPIHNQFYFQWDDSAGLTKFPGMSNPLIMELFGDSAQAPFHKGQPFRVPFFRNGDDLMRAKAARAEKSCVMEETPLADMAILRNGGFKNAQMVKPSFDDQIEVEVDGSTLRITMLPLSGTFKKLDIRLLDGQGKVITRETVKNSRGPIARSFSLEYGKLYYVAIADGSHFLSKKIKVNKI